MRPPSGRAGEAARADRPPPPQSLLDAAVQVATLTTDPDGVILRFGSGAERMLGYAAAEVVGRSVTILQAQSTTHLATERPRAGRSEEREWTWQRKDGRPIRVSLCVSPLAAAGGQPTGLLFVARDLSAVRLAEQTLRDNEARVRAIVDAASDAILTVDADGRIDSLNPAAEALFGYPAAEVLGQNITLLLPPAAEQDDVAVTPLPAGDISRGRQLVARRRDGELFAAEMTVGETRVETGVLFTVVVRDVTWRNRTEAELHKAKEAAEAASRLKGEFLANMSHEIRTPLNAILGMTQLLLDAGPTAEQREYLDIVHSSGQSLLALLNDILDFSKIEAGKLDLESVEFGLRETVGRVQRTLRHRATGKGLRLGLDVDAAVPDRLVGDPSRLAQVLVNLVGNAVKFTERGEVVVRVRTPGDGGGETGASPSAVIVFEVRDTGIGIAQEQLDRIFEPFEQADSSTTRRFGGTGLGLAISARLVCLMGGQIGVRSAVGQGSTFLFSLPFGVRPGPIPPTPSAPSAQGVPPPAGLRGRRILVAEDNAVNQLLVQRLLTRQGAQVAVAGNGREALEALSRESFDVVLMDVQMPEMDGLEATLAIRAAERGTGRHVPIVALTAHAMKGDRDRCLAAGMDAYLTKPIQQAELFATLGTWLGVVPDAAAAPEVAFDRAGLLARAGGDEGLMHDLARLFLDDCPQRLDAIRAALDDCDAAAVQRAAHYLKGAIGLFGLAEATQAVRDLERVARAGDLAGAEEAFAALRTHARRLTDSLAVAVGAAEVKGTP